MLPLGFFPPTFLDLLVSNGDSSIGDGESSEGRLYTDSSLESSRCPSIVDLDRVPLCLVVFATGFGF